MPVNDQLVELSIRVGQLERRVRRYRRLEIALAVVIAGVLVIGARKDSKVRGSAFELRDSAGRLRLEVALDSKGSPAVNFLDPGGKPRIVLGMDPLGYPGLELNDAGGVERIGLGFDPDGSPTLEIMGKDGRERLVAGLDEQQNPLMNLKDGEGLMRSFWGLDDGTPTFWVGNNTKAVRLSTSASGDARVAISDSSGHEQLLLRGRDHGSPVIQLDHLGQSCVLDHQRLVFVKGTTTTWASPIGPGGQ